MTDPNKIEIYYDGKKVDVHILEVMVTHDPSGLRGRIEWALIRRIRGDDDKFKDAKTVSPEKPRMIE